jgi:hypothetical protein
MYFNIKITLKNNCNYIFKQSLVFLVRKLTGSEENPCLRTTLFRLNCLKKSRKWGLYLVR